jgi:FMN reductase (NADPH)
MHTHPALRETETISLLNARVSIRKFHPEPPSEEAILKILNAARRAPTSSNLQAYSFVVVRDQETKNRLSVLTGNQKHVAETPVFIAVCADLSRLASACELHGKEFAGHTIEMALVAAVDASLAGMSAALAAESLGYSSVMIGGVRNEPLKISECLGLPSRCFAVFGMCIGVPDGKPSQKPRLPEEAVIHYERYDASSRDEALKANVFHAKGRRVRRV